MPGPTRPVRQVISARALAGPRRLSSTNPDRLTATRRRSSVIRVQTDRRDVSPAIRTPRWKRFVIQGLVLLVVAGVTSGFGEGPLALIIAVIGGVLVVAGLIGGAVNSDDSA